MFNYLTGGSHSFWVSKSSICEGYILCKKFTKLFLIHTHSREETENEISRKTLLLNSPIERPLRCRMKSETRGDQAP